MAILEPTAVSRPRPADAVPGYRLEKLLGKGGMGEVHLATQLSLGRKVAVKLLRDDLARDEAFVARFEKESAALASLRHPNIVTLLDKGKTDITYFLVMELVEGPSLREVMRRPDWEPLLALRLFDQVARGVEYAHQQGVIHRDLKPENILLDEPSGGTPKVTDFGLAGFDEKAAIQLPLTQTHMAMGTASYMAPEQQIDARSVDHRADIYALGVLLYELLTGEVPRGTFQLPSVRKPGVDKRLDPVVTRCLKPDPKDRYPSVAELRKDLEVVLPATSLLTPSRLTRGQKAKLWLRQAGRAAVRTAEGMVVVSALAVLLVAALRDGAAKGHQSAGLELTVDSGVRRPSTVVGRLDRDALRLTLGEGPDAVPLVAHGRPITVDRGSIVFGVPDELTAGRTVVDAVPPGDGLSVSTTVTTTPPPSRRLEGLRTFLKGPRASARSALLLEGDSGRFVALVVGADGSPPRLEWALGSEKRGEMVAPLPGEARQALSLEVNPDTGLLSAWLGEGKDRRRLGESLELGKDWRRHFGEPPHAAVGCLEGACRFENVTVQGLKLTPPPAPPEPEVSQATVGTGRPGGHPELHPVVTAKPVASAPHKGVTPVPAKPKKK